MTPERKQRLLSVLDKRQPELTVILENIFDPHNIAAVMRSCDSVGIQEVFIVQTEAPRKKRWGARSSAGAKKWLTIHNFSDVDACVEAVRRKYDKIFTTHMNTDSRNLYDLDFTKGSMALVFGNELYGVSARMVSHSDGNFIIPQVGVIKSLNISVACAVTLYEAYRQRAVAGLYDKRRLDDQTVNELAARWGYEWENFLKGEEPENAY